MNTAMRLADRVQGYRHLCSLVKRSEVDHCCCCGSAVVVVVIVVVVVVVVLWLLLL